ncbi:hypothetical protein [Tranquillimonas rosea]|uniref:hypothetical protein n=1 Tax=Tranquillimonas rosea TaxID=641238 RepID=UPI003BAA4D3A
MDNPLDDLRVHAVDYDKQLADAVPEHLREGLARYLLDGGMPGSFLRSFLQNDLFCTLGRADEVSLAALPAMMRFMHSCAPYAAYGNSHAVIAWSAKGGYRGRAA